MAEQTAPPVIRADAAPIKADAAVVRDALGVGVAVGLSGFAFGVTSAGSGLTLLQTCVLSLLVFTGASQFALVGALASGGNPFTAAAGAFFLGTRNAFYGLRLSQLLALPRAVKPFAAHWVIDETAAVALAQPSRRAVRLGFTVTGLTLYLLWNLTTFLGALGAEAIGDTSAWGLDAAGPATFLALLAPMLRTATELAQSGKWRSRVLEKPEIWGLESISDEAMVIRIVMKVRTSSKDDVARELRTRLKHAMDAMGVTLPSLSSVVLSGFDGATRVKGAKPPKTGPSSVVTTDASRTAIATKPKVPRAPRAPKPPATGGTQ